MKTYIHVNQHVIRANKKHGKDDPCITVKRGKTNTYCHEVEVHGPSKVRYDGGEKPILSCGARVVIETNSDVVCMTRDVEKDVEIHIQNSTP